MYKILCENEYVKTNKYIKNKDKKLLLKFIYTFSHLKRPFNVAGYTPKPLWDTIFY